MASEKTLGKLFATLEYLSTKYGLPEAPGEPWETTSDYQVRLFAFYDIILTSTFTIDWRSCLDLYEGGGLTCRQRIDVGSAVQGQLEKGKRGKPRFSGRGDNFSNGSGNSTIWHRSSVCEFCILVVYLGHTLTSSLSYRALICFIAAHGKPRTP